MELKMVEIKTNLCDVCKERTSKKECAICGIDLCNYCGKECVIDINSVNQITYPLCKKCNSLIFKKDILEKIKEETIKTMKKGEVIRNIT